MNLEKQLLEVTEDIAKRETSVAEIEPKLIELIKTNIGKPRQPASIQTQRRKLYRHREKLQELTLVKQALQKEIDETRAKEADERLRERAESIVGELQAFAAQVRKVNKICEELEVAVTTLRHPLDNISDSILQCHQNKKLTYVDVQSIYRNIPGLVIKVFNQNQITDANLGIKTGLNRLHAALKGQGVFHKAKPPVRDAHSPEVVITEAQRIREEMEIERWRDGGPSYPQFGTK